MTELPKVSVFLVHVRKQNVNNVFDFGIGSMDVMLYEDDEEVSPERTWNLIQKCIDTLRNPDNHRLSIQNTQFSHHEYPDDLPVGQKSLIESQGYAIKRTLAWI